jgi:hypothetical protein
VANVVQPDAGQAGSVSQPVEADGDRVWVRWAAVLPAEQQPVILVVLTGERALGVEHVHAGAQYPECVGVERDGAPTVVGLAVLLDYLAERSKLLCLDTRGTFGQPEALTPASSAVRTWGKAGGVGQDALRSDLSGWRPGRVLPSRSARR